MDTISRLVVPLKAFRSVAGKGTGTDISDTVDELENEAVIVTRKAVFAGADDGDSNILHSLLGRTLSARRLSYKTSPDLTIKSYSAGSN